MIILFSIYYKNNEGLLKKKIRCNTDLCKSLTNMDWKNNIPTCNSCDFKSSEAFLCCPNCNNVIFIPPIKGPSQNTINLKSMWSLHQFLPKLKNQITLFEGNTPIIDIKNIPKLHHLKLKLEFRNPTGSFRDRASSLIISDAIDKGYHSIVGASTGSFGISLSAYASRGNIKSINFLPKNMDLSKIEQIKLYGSEIEQKGQTLDETIQFAEKRAKLDNIYNSNLNNNILTIEGQKTIALEISMQLSEKIENVIIPRGTGTLILSIYQGFQDAKESGWISKIPRIFSVSLKRSKGSYLAESIKNVNPYLLREVSKIVKKTNGRELQIPATEMLMDAILLARQEGLFIEPASASVISGAKILKKEDGINLNSTIAILTGSGLNTLNIFASQIRDIKKVIWGVSGTSTQRIEILNLIAENKANHGYAIWISLGKKKTLQSVYKHLDNLKKSNLIVNQYANNKIEGKNKAYFTITEKGLEILEKMRDIIDLT